MKREVLVALSIATLAVGFGGAALAQDDKVVIGYSAPGLVGAQAQIQAGLVKGATAKGWEVLTSTSGGDAQKQLNDINDFIAQKVAAIVAVPDDSAGVCQAVKAAKEANIPFYTIDRAPQGCEIDMVVLSDNYLAGKQSGEATVEFFPDRRSLIVIGPDLTAQVGERGARRIIDPIAKVESCPGQADGWSLWVGRIDGRPVATAAAWVRGGLVGVEWISARPETRGRGVGAAVTWAATLADPTLPAMLIASDLGQPVYERMGYLRLTRFTLWFRSR